MCENSSGSSYLQLSRGAGFGEMRQRATALSAMRFSMCGDAAFNVEFGAKPDVLLTRAIASLHATLAASAPAGFIESVPGLTSLTILFDPDSTSADALQQAVQRCVHTSHGAHAATRTWNIPVCYSGEYAPDLEDVATACGISTDAVVAAHTSRTYVVYLLGFSPGFPYLGDIDERIALPRRAEPRPRVPAGSVAIATHYTAVYPQSTAGGWHIIGRTPLSLFDARQHPPALLAAGDSVRFYSIEPERYDDGDLLSEFRAG